MTVACKTRFGTALITGVILAAAIVCGAQEEDEGLQAGNYEYWHSNYAEAETYLTEFLAATPGSAVGFNNRGLARYHQGNFAGADADFDAAKALDAAYVAPYINKGRSLAAQRSFSGAVAEYQAGLVLSPNNPKLLYGLGWVYDEQRQYAQALAHYDAALTADANYHRARTARAVTLAKQEQNEAALLAFYDVSNTVDEGDFQAALAAYNIQVLRGNGLNFTSETAAQDYQEGIFMMGASAHLDAISFFQRAEAQEPAIPDIPWLRAWCHMLRRDPASTGNAALTQACALMPHFDMADYESLTMGSTIYVDGAPRGILPASAHVFVGPHDLTIRYSEGTLFREERAIVAYADGNPGGQAPTVVLPSSVASFTPFGPVADTDRDWLGDEWEMDHFGSLSHNPGDDADGDGLSNLEEYWLGTDPLNPDTSGSGFTDEEEVERGWDPRVITRVIRVDAANASGTEDGLSWETAFTSLQAGVDAATATGDGEVWVAAGTYTATSDTVLVMKRRVRIFGGFNGTENRRSPRDYRVNLTSIDGQEQRRCVEGASHARLDGFTVTRGKANYDFGSGMRNRFYSTPTVSNCTFTKNTANGSGGGMANMGNSSPMLTNCVFEDNYGDGMLSIDASLPRAINCKFTGNSGNGMRNVYSSPKLINCTFTANAANCGGGMYNQENSPTLINCTLTANAATGTQGGGGMYNELATPTLTDCVFTDNMSVASGGGMCNLDSTPTLTNCVFTYNTATGSQEMGGELGGGGMANARSSPTLTNCTFTENMAAGSFGSGGIINYFSSPTLTNCTFTENSGGGMGNLYSSSPILNNCTFTENYGDGMYNYDSLPALTNCIIIASYGDGMYNRSSSPTLTNCVLTANSRSAIYNESSSPTLTNCILWANSAGEGNEIFGTPATVTHSCITGGYEGTANINADPLFVNAPYSLQLLPDSPCIDTGTSDGAPDADILGHSRPVGAGVDMGAYEGVVVPEDQVVLTLSTYPEGYGVTKPPVGIHAYERGTIALLRAQAVGRAFSHWTGDVFGGDRTTTILMDGDKTATAVFVENIYCVDANSAASDPDGRSWETAYPDLQSAVDAASAAGGGEVWVVGGVYTAATERVLTMKRGVALYGGFVGQETERDQRDWEANFTVIDGEDQRGCVQGANYAVLDGFTITRGSASSGGGMYNSSSSPAVTNCVFTENTATDYPSSGGGMYNSSSSPTLTNCVFTKNKATSYYGGGMYNSSSSPTLTNCVFTENTATSYYGGGMYNSSSSPKLTNCTFTANRASCGGGAYNSSSSSSTLTNCMFTNNTASYGGGMYNSSSSSTLTNCTFTKNTSYWEGGGLHNSSSSPTLINCMFTENAANAGGGMYNASSAPMLTNCIFANNTTTNTSNMGEGGGIYNSSSSPTLINCVFTDNASTYYGGGMYNGISSSPTLTNCAFTANTATYYGGGMYNSSSSPTLTNCILWANSAGEGNEIYGTPATVTHSCITGGYAGTANINADPLFVNAPYSLQLLPDSPCIDTGTSDGAPDADILGHPRPVGAGVDMGAYEYPLAVITPALVGMAQEAAQETIVEAGLRVGAVSVQCHASMPANHVISQDPAAGTEAPSGSAVTFVLSTGPCPVTVPDVVGLTQAAAETAIMGAGLALSAVTEQCSNTVTAGLVISQDPLAGQQALFGSAVAFVVSTGPCPVAVPNVVGLTQAAASTAITNAGLTVGTVTEQYHATIPAGQVISQNPLAGVQTPPGTAVELTVSRGPAPVSVPNVVGLTQVAASTAITNAGLTVGAVTEQYHATIPAGQVISQDPLADTPVPPGTAVELTVSRGPAPVSVPNVVGLTQAAASTAITNAGLAVGTVTEQCSNTVSAGLVITQDPLAGQQALFGSAVAFVVSTGPCPVAVPNVVGLTQAAAEGAITGLGLTVGTVVQSFSDTVPVCQVMSQHPTADTEVLAGSAVNLEISKGPAPSGDKEVPNVVGMTQAQAGAALVAAELTLGAVTEAFSTTVPAGQVISQNPAAGVMLAAVTPVNIVVSKGPEMVLVPNVVGLTLAAAEGAISGAGLAVGVVTEQCSSTVTAGLVISHTPVAGIQAAPGSTVALVVSVGPCNVTVPNVVGQTQSAAQTNITEAGLTVGLVTQQCSGTVADGLVAGQIPAAGSQTSLGSAVSLVVSTGPCNVTVPNVAGLTAEAAYTAITNAGLAMGTVTEQCSGTVAEGIVIGQTPAAGTLADPGSPVATILSSGPCDAVVPNVVGQTQSSARNAITEAGLSVGDMIGEHHATVPAGTVISQDPAAGTSVLFGSAVSLVVSLGPVPPTVEEARSLLAAGFDAADTNGDNFLSFEEASDFVEGLTQEVFDELDTNGDRFLTRAELGLEEDEEEEEGCGCGCNKSNLTPESLKKRLGDLFMAGLALGLLAAWGLRRH